MTEILPKPIKILPKPIKLPKYPLNLKNDWNTPETYKITKIPKNL